VSKFDTPSKTPPVLLLFGTPKIPRKRRIRIVENLDASNENNRIQLDLDGEGAFVQNDGDDAKDLLQEANNNNNAADDMEQERIFMVS
jgi:hypothetical protein